MKRALTDRLANLILSGNIASGSRIVIDADGDGLTFRAEAAGVAEKTNR
jgi:hypothetical protein